MVTNKPSYIKAKELWTSGMSMKRIAYECDININTLTYWTYVHREDFPARKKQTVLNSEQRNEVINLHNSGMHYQEIADKFGVHRNTIGKIVRLNND